jgi:hypothetical protein
MDNATVPYWPAAIGAFKNGAGEAVTAVSGGGSTPPAAATFYGHSMGQFDSRGNLAFVHHNQLMGS